LQWKRRFPVLHEKRGNTSFDRHYIYHSAWAARVLAKLKPAKHIDISSSLFFNVIASAFTPIECYEYNPVKIALSNFDIKKGDVTRLPFEDNSIKSLSCMHVVEHIGLGRYGDKLDPDGDLKAMKELTRVLARSGSLLFVVPVGKSEIRFNSHRVYSYDQVINSFNHLKLVEFAFISEKDTHNTLILNPEKEFTENENYGCGCFWFKK
jgi:predicted SAM-dependent methyltransferase